MSSAPRFILFGASAAVVASAVAAGLMILGSPARERERRIDDRRVADLHGIAVAADLHWSRHSRLPATLDDLAAEPGARVRTRDPASSESYGYEPLDNGRYEVCARFDHESAAPPGDPARIPPLVEAGCRSCHGPGSVAPAGIRPPAAGHSSLPELWAHGAGRQCFELRARTIGQ